MKPGLSRVLVGGALLVSCLAGSPVRAGIEVEIFPPPAYIATFAPVYFEGRPAYWYHNRWYYRDGRAWRFYHDEPRYLHDWRDHHEFERHYYERRYEHRH